MERILLKFGTLGEVSLSNTREEITKLIRKEFEGCDYCRVFETQHNLLVEHNEYDRLAKSRIVIHVVFDDNNNIVSIYVADTINTGFEGIKVGSKKIKLKDIPSYIKTLDGYIVDSECPYLNRLLTEEELSEANEYRPCNTCENAPDFYKNCKECACRSRIWVKIDLTDTNETLKINEDNMNGLLLVRAENKYDWNSAKFGYIHTEDGNNIVDMSYINSKCENEETNEFTGIDISDLEFVDDLSEVD